MATPKVIKTKSAPSPVGPYNQAVLAGEWLFCSGQIALDPKTGEMKGQDDIKEETQQVLENLLSVLSAAGAKASDIVKTTIYLVDLNDFEKVNSIYAKTFTGKTTPARACVEVSKLPKGGKVEIDCIAWLVE
tara:strand:+ start:335 stop:730 length:396 start_codon:yes stop_codon:yes gene_type:complete